jgi:hypothetical protein
MVGWLNPSREQQAGWSLGRHDKPCSAVAFISSVISPPVTGEDRLANVNINTSPSASTQCTEALLKISNYHTSKRGERMEQEEAVLDNVWHC